eukprot:PhF_6_TR42159/c0_g1_i1/m.63715
MDQVEMMARIEELEKELATASARHVDELERTRMLSQQRITLLTDELGYQKKLTSSLQKELSTTALNAAKTAAPKKLKRIPPPPTQQHSYSNPTGNFRKTSRSPKSGGTSNTMLSIPSTTDVAANNNNSGVSVAWVAAANKTILEKDAEVHRLRATNDALVSVLSSLRREMKAVGRKDMFDRCIQSSVISAELRMLLSETLPQRSHSPPHTPRGGAGFSNHSSSSVLIGGGRVSHQSPQSFIHQNPPQAFNADDLLRKAQELQHRSESQLHLLTEN